MAKLSIELPKKWEELTDQQLYYAYNLIADNLAAEQIKTYCLFRWGRVLMVCRYGDGFLVKKDKTDFYVTATAMTEAIQSLNYLDDLPQSPVRISRIKGHDAADACLKDIDLQTYLACDNLFQGFLATQNHDLLGQMGKLLYNYPKMSLNQAERMSLFYWWCTAKEHLARQFPNLLKGEAPQEQNLLGETRPLERRIKDAMNNQIRALTKGDITKEQQVLEMNLYRALTELDALAKEAEELNRKYNNHGK